MAIIEVEGAGRFEVDDKFLDLPEAEQQSLLREMTADTGDGPLTGADALIGTTKGVNTALFADVLGAPVDLATFGLNLLPGVEIQEPVGGSKQLRGLLADANIGYKSVADLPRQQQPFAIGGETLGAAIPIAGGVGLAARGANLATRAAPTGSAVRDLLSDVVSTAARKPGTTAATELGLATTAGVGGGLAETIAPGNELARLGGEVAGGLAPAAALATVGKGAKRVLDVARSFTPSGRERLAADVVQRRAVKEGVDREQLAKRLLEDDEGITSAQRVPEAFLIELENTLRRTNSDLDARLGEANKQVIENIKDAFVGGRADPEIFADALDTQINLKLQTARQAAAKINPSSPDARSQANRIVRDALEGSLRDARKQESALWGQVDRDITIAPNSTLQAYKNVKLQLLEEEGLPAPVEAFAARIKKILKQDTDLTDADLDAIDRGVMSNTEISDVIGRMLSDVESPSGTATRAARPKKVTSGDLLRFRSRLLSMSRDALRGENPSRALSRQLKLLADGALYDLSRLDVMGVDDARQFSFALNQRFSRGDVGRILEFDAQATGRIDPDLTLESTIRRGGPAAAVASRDIQQAVSPLEEFGRNQTPEVRAQIEEFLRDMARQTVTKSTGEIKPEALATFRANNREILRQFPQLDNALKDAGTAARSAESYVRGVTAGSRTFQQVSALGDAIQVESAPKAVKAALGRFNRSTDQMDNIIAAARAGGDDAVAGLRTILMDELLDAATVKGKLSGKILQSTSGQQRILDYLQSKGVLDATRRENLKTLADTAARVEQYLTTRAGKQFDLGKTGPFEDFLIRVIGARIGALSFIGEASGATLVAAGAGSRALRSILSDMPALRVRDVLARAVEDPEFMAELLSKPTSVRARNARDTRILSYLLASGLVAEDE